MVQDFLLDDDNDDAWENGDFVVGESDAQHVHLLLITSKGDWRKHPLVGVGIRRYINGPSTPAVQAALAREITIQLELDGYKLTTIDTRDLSNIQLDAERI